MSPVEPKKTNALHVAASSAQISRAVLKAVRLTAGVNRTIWEPISTDFATRADLARLITCIEAVVRSAFDAPVRITTPTDCEADQLLTEAYLELVPFIREKLAPDREASRTG